MSMRWSALVCLLAVGSASFVGELQLQRRGVAVAAARRAVPAPCMAASGPMGRRDAMATAAAAAAALCLLGGSPSPAMASGGATAGKTTTIPIAKRRYFGRVKQGVFEFLAMENAVFKGELTSDDIGDFFADTIVVSKKRTKTNCLAPGTSACNVQDTSTSRWEDMKLSCFLLGNAFRVDSGKPPEKVKQVKEAKVFFAEVEKVKKATGTGDKKSARVHYAAAKEALDIFLNDVELPPTNFPDYKSAADVSVPSLCQGAFCI